ncbi:DctP family TRAP transporter solute-binding subunit [Sedimentibacter hydroxybenzoicus DSM 7310]|uniref:DctP family TRAP transporter solute-binding subunit n=1 Tax=Sedimentibacter hydroxybenzoicus DSM 7310 TaxID=1123245 RepID=A0A974BLJ7_SEDHY|nr:DctP family TRAP transporter solute-binding subunit [Sedimentibacter hydroxybenzoicus]NYB74942.1 DctP family TRAP transporter solute-binding subunit [Sedimentibacter hydroxybenzoicus DSM 7310]
MIKRIKAIFILIVFTMLILSGCNSNETDGNEKVAMKMTVTGTDQGSDTFVARKFSELVNERSGGSIQIDVYTSDQLAGGNQSKGIEMLSQGLTDIGIYSQSTLAKIDEKIAVCNLPWAFTSYEHANEIFDSTGGEYMRKIMDANGLVYLDNAHNALRQISNSKRSIRSPEDLKDLKIRVPGGAIFLDTWNAFGADPIAMSWSEVFTALQQKTIDGQENGIKTSDSNNIYEVNKYFTVWNYMYDGYPIIVNKDSWNKLSQEQQQILQECATEACKIGRNDTETQEKELIQKFIDNGVEVTILNEEEINAFKEIVQPVIDKFEAKFGEEACTAFGIQ